MILTLDALVLLVVTDQHVVVAQVIAQRIGNLVIQEAEQLVAVVDQVDQHAQATEDRRIFTTDDPGSVDDHSPRGVAEVEDGVAVVDPRMAEVDIGRTVGTRAGGHHHLLGHQLFHHAVVGHHLDGVLVGETGGTEEHVDAIACIVASARGDLLVDHQLGALQHIGEGEPARLADLAEHRIGVELQNLADRMTQGLGGNGAQVRAVATNQLAAIHHRHLAPALGGAHRRPLACRARAQHHHVIVVDGHLSLLRDKLQPASGGPHIRRRIHVASPVARGRRP
ncbi:hypothetical protein D3C75_615120 [compost metagenome]